MFIPLLYLIRLSVFLKYIGSIKNVKLRSVAEPSVGVALTRAAPSECYWLVNASPLNNGWWVDQNYGPVSRRLWTKVHQITSAYAGEIVVCNAIFRLSRSCSVPEIFAIEVRSRPKSRHKTCFSAPFFCGEDPQILDLVFNIAPIFDHVAKFRGDRPRDRGDLALKKKKKAAKHKGSTGRP